MQPRHALRPRESTCHNHRPSAGHRTDFCSEVLTRSVLACDIAVPARSPTLARRLRNELRSIPSPLRGAVIVITVSGTVFVILMVLGVLAYVHDGVSAVNRRSARKKRVDSLYAQTPEDEARPYKPS